MKLIETHLITLAASAQQLPAPATTPALISRLYVEPLRSNLHVSYVGSSSVTADASGTGVISELAQPPAATVPNDHFDLQDDLNANTIDPTAFWVHGTTGEKMKVSYFQR